MYDKIEIDAYCFLHGIDHNSAPNHKMRQKEEVKEERGKGVSCTLRIFQALGSSLFSAYLNKSPVKMTFFDVSCSAILPAPVEGSA